jgi:hypothetical protein
MHQPGPERRRHERLPARFLVSHTSHVSDAHEPEFHVDYARDVSRSGIFIETTRPLPKSTTLHVQFSPRKDATLISAFARVTHQTPTGIGAEFISLDADAIALLGG